MYFHKANKWNLLDFLDPCYSLLDVYFSRDLKIGRICQDHLLITLSFYTEESEAHKD